VQENTKVEDTEKTKLESDISDEEDGNVIPVTTPPPAKPDMRTIQSCFNPNLGGSNADGTAINLRNPS
jgi:hypothetical protein